MVSKREVGLTLLGLAVGLIIIWIIRIGISINLFWGVLLVATGAIIGFVIEWVIDEAYRRDPELRRRLAESSWKVPFVSEDVGPAEGIEGKTALDQAQDGVSQAEAGQVEREGPLQQPIEPGDRPVSADRDGSAQSSPQAATETLVHLLQQRDEVIQTLRAELTKNDQQLEAIRTDFEHYQRSHPDDLTIIKGIGPVYQRKLRDLGVGSYKQLAAVDAAWLRRMLDVKHWQRVEIESWIEQARDWTKQA